MRTASTNDKHPRYDIARLIFCSLIVFSGTLFAIYGSSAQSPPTASEAFNLRIKCKKMSDEKAQDFIDASSMAKWQIVAAFNVSKYDPTSNRCYGRIYEHIIKPDYGLDHESDQIYDLQVDDLLASARIENDKKSGDIDDPEYKKPWMPTCVGGCPANFGEQTWQAAKDYMNEMMTDPRKQ